MSGLIKKYSVRINGHPTSISLEPAFWAMLHRIADDLSVPVAQLIARIDQQRIDTGHQTGNLSSALRVFVLQHVQQMQGVGPHDGESNG